MNSKLETHLLSQYPTLFAQYYLSPQQTCMCWGIATGDGWYTIINDLCFELSSMMCNKSWEIQFTQIKEKFGALRVYYTIVPSKPKCWWKRYFTNWRHRNVGVSSEECDLIDQWVDAAEQLSQEVCEQCGSTDDVSQTSGWITTLCRSCKIAHRKEDCRC